LEPLDLYKKKSGEEIVGQLYHFVDQGGREVALRPELTPTLARMAGTRHRDFKKPMKWFSIPQLFRYERQQRGRLREHFQWNCDILGEEGLGAEAELLSVLTGGLRRLGLGPEHIEVRISDRLFWQEFLDERSVSEERRKAFYQALDKMEREDPVKTRELLGDLADDTFAAIERSGGNARLQELIGRLRDLGLGEYVSIDLRIVRGLAYYTGIVFEVHDRARQFRAIAGGGRYDHLVELLTGNSLAAVGFGMGDVVISELLKDLNLLPKPAKKAPWYVVVADESVRGIALSLVGALRLEGLAVEYPLEAVKVGRQFQQAEERGAVYALVVDAKATDGFCGLKNLAERSQSEVAFKIEKGRAVFEPSLPDTGVWAA
jgi:histidyl-tRNA synthetase